MAMALEALKRRVQEHGIPVSYANDNFGRWRSDFRKLIDYCSRKGTRGREIVLQLKADGDDYFILKPKHSAFFQTNLKFCSNSRRLVCMLFSVNDA